MSILHDHVDYDSFVLMYWPLIDEFILPGNSPLENAALVVDGRACTICQQRIGHPEDRHARKVQHKDGGMLVIRLVRVGVGPEGWHHVNEFPIPPDGAGPPFEVAVVVIRKIRFK